MGKQEKKGTDVGRGGTDSQGKEADGKGNACFIGFGGWRLSVCRLVGV